MPRKKQIRFEKFKELSNCIEIPFNNDRLYELPIKKEFRKYKKIILEIGCGKGEYTCALAESNPENFYIGLDIKSERLYVGASFCLQNKLNNAYFIRSFADYVDFVFDQNSIDEIWLTFPDPRAKKDESNKRLTHPKFLDKYIKILKKNGILHLKTDNKDLFKYSKEVFENDARIKILLDLNSTMAEYEKYDYLNIRTNFENKFRSLGSDIFYTCFEIK